MFADVIFPAPSAAYVACFFIPLSAILAVATEFAVYVRFQRGVISLWWLFGVVFGVNIISWVVGIFSSLLLPTFLVPQLVGDSAHRFTTIGPGPYWDVVAILSFVWACAVSTILEYFALWLFRKKLGFRQLGSCVTIANVAGYIIIGATVWVFLTFGLV